MTKFEKIINNISLILEERGKDWPYRKEAAHNFRKEIHKFYLLITKSNEFKSLSVHNFNNKFQTLKSKPVIICGNMKSGTSLLGQLLDNHPDLFVFPGDSHFFNFSEEKTSINVDEFSEWWLRKIINPTGQKPFFPFGKNYKDYILFVKLLRDFYNKENIIDTILRATLHTFSNKNKSYTYWAEKTPMNEFHFEKITKLYPNAKFIHIYRNPFANIVSLKKLETVRQRKSATWLKAVFYRLSYEKAVSNSKKTKNYIIIKYEDLISDTEKEMKKICDILQISYRQSMLQPTVNGIPATANSMFKEKRKEGVIINEPKYFESLSRREKTIIYSINHSIIKKNYFSKDFAGLNNRFYKYFFSFSFLVYKFYRYIRFGKK